MASRVGAALAVAALLQGAEGLRERREQEVTNQTVWNTVLIPGKSKIKRPAFMMYDPDHDDIVISQFGRASPLDVINPINLPAQSTISRVPRASIARQITARSFTENYGDKEEWNKVGLEWPNKLAKTPSWMGDFVVVPDGFLPPGKSDGGLFLCDRAGVVKRISQFLSGAFYHEIEWHDFNGDGREDILTVRAVKGGSLLRPTWKGEMLWYENPGKANMFNLWTERLIVEGPDVIFKSIRYNGGLAIYCTEFFRPDPRLTIRFLSLQGVHQSFRIVDGNMGKPFGIMFADLDNDGKKEMVTTNHQGKFMDNNDAIKPAVFGYDVPADIAKGDFKRYTIAWDVSPLGSNDIGTGAPGFAYAFHPQVGSKEKPWLAVAGDGCRDVWIMRPTSTYMKYNIEVVKIGGTTGELLVMDFNNDGIMDILLPDNDYFNLRAITFSQR